MEDPIRHQALLCLDSYPQENGPITFRETHISRLYFTAKHVYKIKKAVNFGFLDFTSLDRRRFYCQEELRLNTRFCAHTYLDVVEIRQHDGRYRVGPGAGEIVDYAVRMKRLPQERMLDTLLITEPETLQEEMRRLGRHLAQLHDRSEVCRQSGRPHFDLVAFNWSENLHQTAPFADDLLPATLQDRIADHVENFLGCYRSLLAAREASSKVIDGHGDLHAEHICLTDPICIYDCIEFNERFRIGDRLNDLAFLLMDLEHRRRRDLAATLLDAYLARTGADPELPLLLPFYKLYRAWVRGKVHAFLNHDKNLPPDQQSAAREEARSYFALAGSYLSTPTLILTCGLMGTGKTTLARQLAEHLDAELLRSDELRKELFGQAHAHGHADPFGSGLYQPELTETTYRALGEKTAGILHGKKSVIVDASFAHREQRDYFRHIANAAAIPLRILWINCDEPTTRQRLERRQQEGTDVSDGRPALLTQQMSIFEAPVDEADIFRVDTRRDIAYNVLLILSDLARNKTDSPSA